MKLTRLSSNQYDNHIVQKLLIFVGFFLSSLFLVQSSYAVSTPVINEFLAHPGTGNKEWVEIYNTDTTIDLSKYWLDDDTSFTSDSGSSAKKSLSTILKGKDVLHWYVELSSILNNTGDYVVLFDPSGNIVDQYQYTDDPGEDIAMGRSPDGTGQFFVLQDTTQGDVNSSPVPTPTPTSQPTSTPTNAPTSANSPTPTRTPTPTPTKIPPSPTKKSPVTPTGASKEADVKEVLGTQSAKEELTSPTPSDKKTPTKQNNAFAGVYLIIAAFLLLACGILIFLKSRKLNE